MTTNQINIPLKIHEKMDRRDLAKMFADKKFNKGAEVGVRWGAFSKILCEANPDLELLSIDPYDVVYQDVRSARYGRDQQRRFYRRAKAYLKDVNAKLIKKTSLEAAREVENESLDFVFIDGSHQFEYVMTDIIVWGWKVKKGGIISGHDYYKFTFGDVVRAVDNYAHIHKVKQINLTHDHTPSWWFERTW